LIRDVLSLVIMDISASSSDRFEKETVATNEWVG